MKKNYVAPVMEVMTFDADASILSASNPDIIVQDNDDDNHPESPTTIIDGGIVNPDNPDIHPSKGGDFNPFDIPFCI